MAIRERDGGALGIQVRVGYWVAETRAGCWGVQTKVELEWGQQDGWAGG